MIQSRTSTTTPSTGRRNLGAGLLAVIAGSTITSGIAAGMAASVTDLVSANPDAELIATCAAFDNLERAIRAVGGHHFGEAEKAADRERKRLQQQQDRHLNRMCTLPARTLAGASALAASLLLYEAGELALEDDPDDYTNARMLSALVRGLVGSAAA